MGLRAISYHYSVYHWLVVFVDEDRGVLGQVPFVYAEHCKQVREWLATNNIAGDVSLHDSWSVRLSSENDAILVYLRFK